MEAETTEFPSVSCKVRDTYTDPLNPVWVQSTPKTHKTPELTPAEKEKRRRERSAERSRNYYKRRILLSPVSI